jgi:hypothetical protein
MGRRSRARRAAGIAPASPTPRAGGDDLPPRPAPLSDERPKAPWHPFPLVELAVLVGIVLIVAGLISHNSQRGRGLLVLGLALGSLGGLDTSAREHFAGYRSHTLVLALLPAVTVAVLLAVVGAPFVIVPGIGVTVFAVVFAVLRTLWVRTHGRSRA